MNGNKYPLRVTLFCTVTVIRESNLLGVQAPADHMSCQTNEWQQYALRLTFMVIRESNLLVVQAPANHMSC